MRCSRRAVAAMEFALIAPVMGIILFGALDLGRAFIAWLEVNNAAEAVVQAAEKLSALSTNTNPPSLTAAQMQAAMTSIYAEMPGLDYGRGDGWLGRGHFAVTLSEVVFVPLCTTSINCPPQSPYTLWSSYLTEGHGELEHPAAADGAALLRSCDDPLEPVAQFPNNARQLKVMIEPTLVTGGHASPTLNLTPQLVADVSFTFYPFFGGFIPSAGVTFHASATLPSPLGSFKTMVNAPDATPGGNPELCTLPVSPIN